MSWPLTLEDRLYFTITKTLGVFPSCLRRRPHTPGMAHSCPSAPQWVYINLFGLGSGSRPSFPTPHREWGRASSLGRWEGLTLTITLSLHPSRKGHTVQGSNWLLTHVHLPGELVEGKPLLYFLGKLSHQTGSWILRTKPADLCQKHEPKSRTPVFSVTSQL